MRHLFLLGLFFLVGWGVASGGKNWNDATQTERWLQDPEMYDPQYAMRQTLPNGFMLLHRDFDIGQYRPGSSFGDVARSNLPLELVKIQSPDGRMFKGLAMRQKDGNFLPVYGKIDGSYSVYYNVDVNFAPLPLPEKLTGKWYVDNLTYFIGDADERWAAAHPGRKNPYPASGTIEDGSEYGWLFLPYISEEWLTFGDQTEYEFQQYWSNDFPRMAVGGITVKKGGKKIEKTQETGGYILDTEVSKFYSVTPTWKPEENQLKLKFGPKTRTKCTVDWHNWEGPKHDSYNQADFDNVNPGAKYLRTAAPKWASQSPDPVWGEITLHVEAVTDDVMVVMGDYHGEGPTYIEVWASDKHEGGWLTLDVRQRVVGHIMNKRDTRLGWRRSAEYRVAIPGSSETAREKNVAKTKEELIKEYNEVWKAFMPAYLKAYTSACARVEQRNPGEDARGKHYYMEKYIDEEVMALFGREKYNRLKEKFEFVLRKLTYENRLGLSGEDFIPVKFTADSMSFVCEGRDGIEVLTFPIRTIVSNEVKNLYLIVDPEPYTEKADELMNELREKSEAIKNLPADKVNALKSAHRNEYKILQKVPAKVKDIMPFIKAYKEVEEYIK